MPAFHCSWADSSSSVTSRRRRVGGPDRTCPRSSSSGIATPGRTRPPEPADVPRFSANLTMLWQELDPYQRFAAAASAGFSRVEMLFPHELDADRLAATLDELGLEMVVFDPAPGDWAAGERGLLA